MGRNGAVKNQRQDFWGNTIRKTVLIETNKPSLRLEVVILTMDCSGVVCTDFSIRGTDDLEIWF